MSYGPNSDADREVMLKAIGVSSVDDLFDDVPAEHRDPVLDLPPALPETDVLRRVGALAGANQSLDDLPGFLGAGFYRHFVPALVDQLLLRSEWYTAYTPYQAEISQGTLQATYEFQTLICNLTGMEVSNASLYDGASALAEAVLMCRGITKRPRVVLPSTVHPAYRQVVAAYTQALEVEIHEVRDWREGGGGVRPDVEAVARAIDDRTSCVVLQRPNFLGWVTDPSPVIEAARAHGALVIVAVSDPVSLALLRPPGELGADVVVGELRSLVGPPAYGGPGAGMFATRRQYIRRMPGRIAGRTTDLDGQEGFVLTLQTREQHIRRERATSNITTNQALIALGATISLCALGREGLRKMAERSLSAAHRCADALAAAGASVVAGAPFFNEFLIRPPVPAAEAVDRLSRRNVMAGVAIAALAEDLPDFLLVCATEMTTAADVEALARAWRQEFDG